jgi:hypothetical protein
VPSTRARRKVVPTAPLRPAEVQAARRRARNRSLRRDGIVLVVVVIVLAVAWTFRQVPNDDLPVATELSERMEATYRAIRAGEVSVGTEPSEVADGIGALVYERAGEQRWVLAAEAGSECYSMWWDETGTRRVRVVPSTLACEPASDLTSPRPETWDRVGQAVPEDRPTASWALILPEPWTYRVWFLPAVIVGIGIGLSAAVRMTIALLTDNAPSAVRR